MLGLCLLLVVKTVGWQDGWVTVRPEDTGEALVNPGMGWVLHYYDNIHENYGSRRLVYVSVGTVTGTPEIALPLPGNDGQKRYLLGQVEVVPSHLPDRSFLPIMFLSA